VRSGYFDLTALREYSRNTESCGSEWFLEGLASAKEPDENSDAAARKQNRVGLYPRIGPAYRDTEPFQRNFSQGHFFSPKRVSLDLPSVP
jgi:hypothetical protein